MPSVVAFVYQRKIWNLKSIYRNAIEICIQKIALNIMWLCFPSFK